MKSKLRLLRERLLRMTPKPATERIPLNQFIPERKPDVEIALATIGGRGDSMIHIHYRPRA